ncbi:Methyltransferase domain-containing protein [Ekhidna lutea]|uniref:Methyltransferase domain-containing protein n=1 Tax=Ekhidna lutea TaxID=447679 RepID=A0A239IPF2_EKHLU|nr:methyltransferase domain-containing protein [Ekhidna lutea]SNS95252.1 Methyltransferase domain-containing protein [Ekhidna lutea]
MLKYRSDQFEIMDDLTVSGEVVNQTLRELNTINKRLGGNKISVSAFKKLAKSNNIILADLGCGGGDIMEEMASWSRKKGLKASFLGIDANPHIVEYAQENTSRYPEISYRAINIFSDEFKELKFDIIHCCLFIHHFTTDELIDLFKQFKKQARIGVIINDLHRHPLAYWSISLLTSLFSKSIMVKNDAAISVSRGFKKEELLHILREAGINEFQLIWKWAFRWKLIF